MVPAGITVNRDAPTQPPPPADGRGRSRSDRRAPPTKTPGSSPGPSAGRGRLGGGVAAQVIAVAALLAACGSTPKPTVAPTVLPAAKPEARQFFEEGLRLLHRGSGGDNLEAAAEQFTKAVRSDQKLFEAWHDLGVIRAKQG